MLLVTVYRDGCDEVVHRFEKPTVMIGRAEGNDICLEGARGVSRYHARADVEEGEIVLQDLNSTNGTFVNAEPVERYTLLVQDRVTIGDVVLGFSYCEEAPAADDTGELRAEADSQGKEQDVSQVEKPEDEVRTSENKPQASTQTDSKSSQDDFYWSSLKNFLGPIWEFLLDDEVSEVMINSPAEIFIEKKGKLERTSASFSEAELKAAVLNIAQYVGRRVSEQEPYLDARLPDGSRVAILMPPCSRKGISLAIRKFSAEALTMDKLLSFGSLSEPMVTFLQACVILRKNIVVSGGTSSGKTSLLNVVSGLIPSGERIITIEDSSELQLSQDHVLPMETRPPDKKGRGQVTIRDLVKASLRMRPDRVIVGEIRGGEALDLLQAMNTGHSGSMATVHASSSAQALTRLETLALFSGLEIPMRALREQVSSAIEIVVQAARLPDHSRKVVAISEVGPLSAESSYQVRDIFRFQRTGGEAGKLIGEHLATGEKPSFLPEIHLAGLSKAAALFDDAAEDTIK
jgi:pilus assembly protein CpaF